MGSLCQRFRSRVRGQSSSKWAFRFASFSLPLRDTAMSYTVGLSSALSLRSVRSSVISTSRWSALWIHLKCHIHASNASHKPREDRACHYTRLGSRHCCYQNDSSSNLGIGDERSQFMAGSERYQRQTPPRVISCTSKSTHALTKSNVCLLLPWLTKHISALLGKIVISMDANP